MCSKKWYLKRNISCDVLLLNGLLETDVAWDDAIVVSAGKLRKLWDSLSELRSSLCERRREMTVVRPALLPAKTVQFTHFFPSGVTSHSKIAQFNWVCIERFRLQRILCAYRNDRSRSGITALIPTQSTAVYVRLLCLMSSSTAQAVS
jgi:hypothetical protein